MRHHSILSAFAGMVPCPMTANPRWEDDQVVMHVLPHNYLEYTRFSSSTHMRWCSWSIIISSSSIHLPPRKTHLFRSRSPLATCVIDIPEYFVNIFPLVGVKLVSSGTELAARHIHVAFG